MKILLVEDDVSFAEELLQSLLEINVRDVVWCKSSRAAIEKRETNFFDAIILDLKIPSADSMSDDDVAHGRLVLVKAQSLAFGTPILILTGSSADRIAEDIAESSRPCDVWGDRVYVQTIRVWRKSLTVPLIEEIEGYARRIRGTDEIEIIPDGAVNTTLTLEERRAVRVIARRYSGAGVRLKQLSGGLSDASVFRARILDGRGASRLSAIIKIMPSEKIQDEEDRCVNLHSLGVGSYAPHLCSLKDGTRGRGVSVYRLAEGYDENLFQVLERSVESGGLIVARLQECLGPWARSHEVRRMKIGDIRRQYVSDDRFSEIVRDLGIPGINELEEVVIRAKIGMTHGDLHGANILINNAGQPIIIDYGDVGVNCACRDPLTLELSVFSHPQAGLSRAGWLPSSSARWADPSEFAEGGPLAAFVRQTRSWLEASCFGQMDIFANLYGYSARQLKYEDTDKILFKRLTIESVNYLKENL